MMNEKKTTLASLGNIDWRMRKLEKINELLTHISTKDITGLNEVIYAEAR